MSISKIHRLSGIIISIFVGVHLFNHMLSVFGAETHIVTMRVLRLFYRHIFFESLLITAVFFQIISGIKLFKQGRKKAIMCFDQLQIWTGFYMVVFFIIHLLAVLVGRLILNLDTNFFYGVAGINTFPFNLFFIPYYGLAIFSFFGHIASIHHKKMKLAIFGVSPRYQSMIIIGIGFFVIFLIFYGLTNQFKGVSIPRAYQLNKLSYGGFLCF